MIRTSYIIYNLDTTIYDCLFVVYMTSQIITFLILLSCTPKDRILLVNPLALPLTLINIDTTDFPVRFVHFLGVALDPFVARIELLRLLFTIRFEAVCSIHYRKRRD
jgi:hypothetical protein